MLRSWLPTFGFVHSDFCSQWAGCMCFLRHLWGSGFCKRKEEKKARGRAGGREGRRERRKEKRVNNLITLKTTWSSHFIESSGPRCHTLWPAGLAQPHSETPVFPWVCNWARFSPTSGVLNFSHCLEDFLGTWWTPASDNSARSHRSKSSEPCLQIPVESQT